MADRSWPKRAFLPTAFTILLYVAWSSIATIAFIGDGEHDVSGIPPFTNHRLDFGIVDISKAGSYRYSFRGFSPHSIPILVLQLRYLSTGAAKNSSVCFRATLSDGKDNLVFSDSACLADSASRYSETIGHSVFLSPYQKMNISKLKKYRLEFEVIGDDPALDVAASTLFFVSGWK